MIDIITHDLKSPTNRILGLIQILDTSNLRDEQLEIIELIKKTNDSSNNIINSILGPSMGENNDLEDYELGPLLKDLTKSYQISAKNKGINFILNVEDRHLISVNKFQLVRILDNLITNAIKYSRVDGEVNISSLQASDAIKILITDSGPGFSETDRELLFQKSTRLTAKPTAKETSHGLGLYIVKKLSNDLGVKIDLIETSAMGSTFEISIPV